MLSTGIAMDVHYCMGKEAGIDFYGAKDDKCSKCGMVEKKGGCCSDDHKFFKYDNSFKNSKNEISFLQSSETIITNSYSFNFDDQFISEKRTSFKIIDINLGGPPIYIRNCVYRL
jgi:hypothetical protein